MRLLSTVLAAILSAAVTGFAAGKAEQVVVVVWDGMRPDFVSETNTPTLHQLAREGVFFQNHHAVFLSSTEVNATAMATGCYPNRSGILGLKKKAIERGMITLRRSGLMKVAQGWTTLEEVARETIH